MGISMRSFEIVTKVEYLNVEKILDVVKNKDCIRDWAYIIHDKDVYTLEEELKNPLHIEGQPKDAHFHICVRFKDKQPQNSEYIAKWFDVPENMVGKVKTRWNNVVKYLTHINAPEKYQYLPEEVVANFDYEEEIKKIDSQDRKCEIMDLIVSGVIKEYNYMEYITHHEYDKYKSSIENAYKYRADVMKGMDRNMECMYFVGESGSGKTTYAKEFAKKKGLNAFISSGSNDVLDGYQGQEVIILDDLRPSCMGLSDLLKMLDNNTSSSVKSRYRNKVLECKYIFITTVLPVEDFYKNVFKDENEPIKQFRRRCKTHMRFTKDRIYTSFYQDTTGDYGKEFEMVNPIKEMFENQKLTEEQAMQNMQELFGDLVQLVEPEEKQDDFISVTQEELKDFLEVC